MRLFCLPYAGGSAERVYAGWKERLPAAAGDRVEVVPLELPGRGSRAGERPVPLADALVAGVVQRVLPWREAPFALFGHSMGAMLAVEAARVLQHRHGVHAAALMVSGCRAPGSGVEAPQDWLLPEARFRERIGELAGTPPEVLANDELMAMFLPVLRADFAVAGQLFGRGGLPVSAPISVFGGDRDPEVPVSSLADWAVHTTADCAVEVLPGGHFFLNELPQRVAEGVGRRLRLEAPAFGTEATR